MADIYDVEQALTTLAASAVYPNGTSSPSVANCDVRIYPGWPLPGSLDPDLTLQKAHVSITPSNIVKATTRFNTNWQTTSQNPPTLTLTVVNNVVTVGGTVSVPQACMVFSNGVGYAYGVTANDTLTTIATALAALIPNATSSGAVITISNNPYNVLGRIITTGTSIRELAREKRLVIVTVWAPTPQIRAQIGYAIQVLFAATYRLGLPDGYDGQLAYSGFDEQDIMERVKCFRRDIHFMFEYAITQTETSYTVGETTIDVDIVSSID